MLMFSDCEHLFLAHVAKRYSVFKRDHVTLDLVQSKRKTQLNVSIPLTKLRAR
jgi:hypothetical protein